MAEHAAARRCLRDRQTRWPCLGKVGHSQSAAERGTQKLCGLLQSELCLDVHSAEGEVRGERSGNRPNPATRRALQYAFNRPIDELLGPYTLSDLPVVGEPKRGTEASEVLTVAADRARRFMTSLQTLSDESLPEILGHLVSGQESVFSLLERPQRPTHARQLYFLSAVLSGLLAKASHDLADPHAALAQSRTAWLCAEQAGPWS